ncbi:MAG: ETC complex I subunit [Rhodobacteraceae bacterium]|nr:ETC complex I subunit [Paracoccaceae bacterium]
MKARIFQPTRSVMQSGVGRSRHWVLEFAPGARRDIDPLMGWTSSGDTQTQVRLTFGSKQAAVEYAQEHGIQYVVVNPKRRKQVIRPRGYGENFAYERKDSWTH